MEVAFRGTAKPVVVVTSDGSRVPRHGKAGGGGEGVSGEWLDLTTELTT